MDQSLRYSPFNSKRRPILRNRKSEFERSGWLPLIVRKVDELVAGTIVHGVALDNPTTHHLGILCAASIDITRPIYFRKIKRQTGDLEINFFPTGKNAPQSLMAFGDCRNEIEVEIKRMEFDQKLNKNGLLTL